MVLRHEDREKKSLVTKIKENKLAYIFLAVVIIVFIVLVIRDVRLEMAPPIEFETVNFGEHSWLVLERQEDRMLLLSEYILFEMAYSSTRRTNTWEESSLREYLNHDFFYTFAPEERTLIISVINKNSDNPRYNADGGGDTEDFVFILNYDEILGHFGDSGGRRNFGGLIHDTYNARRVAYDVDGNYAQWWWVRTPGHQRLRAVLVSPGGSIHLYGDRRQFRPIGSTVGRTVTCSDIGVRPAMWVEVDGF